MSRAAGKAGNLREKLDGNELDLSLSDLSEIPVRDLAAIPKATVLDLSCNKLSTLPVDFCSLTHIVRLDLSKNQILQLPSEFGRLVNLQHLDLLQNRLKALPVTFAQLKSLKWLDLKDNPLNLALAKVAGDCLDEKQCKECAQKVLQYMKVIQAEKDQELQRKLQQEQAVKQKRETEQKKKEERDREQRRKQKAQQKARKRKDYDALQAAQQEEKKKKKKKEPVPSENHSRTTRKVKTRIAEHLAYVNKNQASASGVAKHFVEAHRGQLRSFTFFGIEKVRKPMRGRDWQQLLAAREASWIHTLDTRYPKEIPSKPAHKQKLRRSSRLGVVMRVILFVFITLLGGMVACRYTQLQSQSVCSSVNAVYDDTVRTLRSYHILENVLRLGSRQ